MNCSVCGRTDVMLLAGINEQTRQSDLTCLICQMRESLRDGDDLRAFDKQIEELEAEDYERSAELRDSLKKKGIIT